MSIGAPSLNTNQRMQPNGMPGPPFSPASADNGLSVDPTGIIVLGQDTAQAGDPAQLLSNREIPFNGFTLNYIDRLAGNNLLFTLDGATNNPISFVGSFAQDLSTVFGYNQNSTTINFVTLWNDLQHSAALGVVGSTHPAGQINPDSAFWESDGVNGLRIAANDPGGFVEIAAGGLDHSSVWMTVPPTGNVQIIQGSMPIDLGFKLQVDGSISTADAVLLHGTIAFTNGAAASVGTLTNAPTPGNPTKWIPVDDSGVTRFIPAW